MFRLFEITVLLIVVAGTACDDVAPDGSGLVVELLAEQPHSADLGVSLSIHARGGGGVYVSVDQGVFLTTAGGQAQMPAVQHAGCLSGTPPQLLFTFDLSVRPVDEESLMFVALYAQDDCTGEILQSRIVAVHPPTANPVSLDAGTASLEAR